MNAVKIQPVTAPLCALVSIPGSKSYTNRALFIASMVGADVIIRNALKSDDTTAMINCLKTLGVTIQEIGDNITIKSDLKNIPNRKYILNALLSGTTIRFITTLACLIPGTKVISGEEGLNKRPIADLVDALHILGADIKYKGKDGFPPIHVTSNHISNHSVTINGSISSQFVSSLLMIAPYVGGLTINIEEDQISKSYIDMTIDIMKHFGVTVKNNDYKSYKISNNQKYKQTNYSVEGDYSSACYFAAIAALTKSKITLKNLNPNSVQGDREVFKILVEMGNEVVFTENEVTVVGKEIKPVTCDMSNCPDQVQTLAVLAAFVDGKTVINGVKSLRVKETDRLAALEAELAKMGVKTEITENSIMIFGGKPKAATIDTYGDHRMAMSFAVAGTKLDGMIIKNPEIVNKTFPKFWEKLKEISINLQTI